MADGARVMVWMAGPEGRTVWRLAIGRSTRGGRSRSSTASGGPTDSDRRVLGHGAPRFEKDRTFGGDVGAAIDVTERREARQALGESLALRSAVFTSLYGHVAALNRDGVVIAVNESWSRFARDNGGDARSVDVGANYVEVCRQAASNGDIDARKALAAIRDVLEGRVPRVAFEYPCHGPSGERWFEMAVEPFKGPEGGVVISHVDVTRRRRAEEEAARQRADLAHALRAATLGELAASLAHEINQPLAAIVSNAQTGRRLLEAASPDRDELKGVLQDIADDGRRAAQVIRRLYALLRKEHAERALVDVNEVIAEITALLRADLERSRVALQLSLGKDVRPVLGDAVQLQQVLLNVLVNACEAMADTEAAPRELTVETVQRGPGILTIAVRDSGTGSTEPDLERLFERFVSTKPRGLGMGLSISRSIIQAHGGRIWATRNGARGLTLHVELPCAEAPAEAA